MSVCSGKLLAIELMTLYVNRDGRWDEVQAGVVVLQAKAQFAGGDVFMNEIQRMNAQLLLRHEGGERGPELRSVARPVDDDPFGKFKQAFRLVPARQGEEAVETDEIEECGLGELFGKGFKDMHGVVWGVAGQGSVQVRSDEAMVDRACERGHGEPVGEGCCGTGGLQRLAAGRAEEDGVEREVVGGGGGYGEVPAMNGVEAPAEERDTHSAF